MVRLANPWLTLLFYAVIIPAGVYFVGAHTFHLGAAGKMALATVVSLGGVALAAWRYWSARPAD